MPAENDALRDDAAAGRRVCRTSKQSVSQCVKRLASGGYAAFPDWQTPLNGIISPSERG